MNMSPADHPTTVTRLVPKLTGSAGDVVARTRVDLKQFATHDGVCSFLRWLTKATGIDPADEENIFSRHYSIQSVN